MPELLDMELITQRIKLKDIPLKDEVILVLKDDYQIDVEDAEFVLKGLTASDMKFEEDERAVISTITTATKDRDNEIVLPEGAILDQYEKNPVVLFGHDHHSLPIGRNEWIKQDKKGLVAKTIYADTPEGNKIFDYRKDGNPLAQSIGFIPIEWKTPDKGTKEEKDGVRRIYTKWILLEYSDVPVPSNPDAVAIAINKALITEEEGQEYLVEVKEIEEKRADLKGNPSVWDIADSIQNAIRPKDEHMRWTKWVVDLFPVKFPNGHVIIAEEIKGKDVFKQFDYTFEDGKAELSKEFIELESGYKPAKDYRNIKGELLELQESGDELSKQREMLEQILENMPTEIKEGRTLSKKTLKSMDEAVKGMDNCCGILKGLIEGAKKPEPAMMAVDEDEVEEKEIITFADDIKPEENEIDLDAIDKQMSEKISKAIKDTLPNMLKSAVKEVLDSARGKI